MIKGNLVNLRFPEPADHRKLVEWRNENLQYFFDDEPVSLENHLDWYERVRQDASQRFFVVTIPWEREVICGEHHYYAAHDDYLTIGTIGLANIGFRHRRAEYGRFLIAEEHRGKGYGKDALATLLKFAFTTLGLYRIYGDILTSNISALRLCSRLGFQVEGTFRAHVYKQGLFVPVTRVAMLSTFKGEIPECKQSAGL